MSWKGAARTCSTGTRGLAGAWCLLALVQPTRADAECQGWQIQSKLRITHALNHDGLSDVVIFGGPGVFTALAAGLGELNPPSLVMDNYGADQGWTPDKHVRAMADVNGDGLADIVGFGTERVWTSLSTGDGRFTAPARAVDNYAFNQGWTPAKHVRALADIDGDGKSDIVGFGTERVFTSLATHDGLFTSPIRAVRNYASDQGWTPEKHVRRLADIDGDGRADIVGFGTERVFTSLATRDGQFTDPIRAVPNYASDQGWTPDQHVRLLADIDGDGRADIVGFGTERVFTSLATGGGLFTDPPIRSVRNYASDQGWTNDKHVRALADINGDGRADIVGFGAEGVWTSLSTGAGQFTPPALALYRFGSDQGWTTANSLRTLADINGDRKADILVFSADGLWTALAKGDGGFENPRSACGGRFDFNLVWPSGHTDPNGFPLNPRWSWQQDHPGAGPPSAGLCHYFSRDEWVTSPGGTTVKVKVPDFADCTNQSGSDLVDTPEGWNAFVCGWASSKGFHGHLNWFPATFTGDLFWGDDNFDDDYYMPLTTEGEPAVLSEPDEPRHELHTEFDTDETVQHFKTPWWNRFRQVVEDADSKEDVRKFLRLGDGSKPFAIMTGLFGVDFEHGGGKSELHPVYALAARVARDATTEAWALFVRNWGNEGYCSRKNWPVELTTYTFRLPWRPRAQSVEVVWGLGRSVFASTPGASGPEVNFTPGRGIDVTFHLPRPPQRPLVEGELHLKWIGEPQPPPAVVPTPVDEEDEREPMQRAFDALTPAQRGQVRRAVVPVPPSVGSLAPLPDGRAARAVSSLPEPPATAPRLGTPEVAARKLARDEAGFKELCRVTNGSPVGLPDGVCRRFDPGPEPCAAERALVASAQSKLKALLDERRRLQAELEQEQSPAIKKKIRALIAELNVTHIPAAKRELAAAEAALAACH